MDTIDVLVVAMRLMASHGFVRIAWTTLLRAIALRISHVGAMLYEARHCTSRTGTRVVHPLGFPLAS